MMGCLLRGAIRMQGLACHQPSWVVHQVPLPLSIPDPYSFKMTIFMNTSMVTLCFAHRWRSLQSSTRAGQAHATGRLMFCDVQEWCRLAARNAGRLRKARRRPMGRHSAGKGRPSCGLSTWRSATGGSGAQADCTISYFLHSCTSSTVRRLP